MPPSRSAAASAFLPLWHRLELPPESAQLAASCFANSPLLLSGVIASIQADSEEMFSVAFPGVGLYDGEVKSAYQSGTLALTSHRVCYFYSDTTASTASGVSASYFWLRQMHPATGLTHYKGFATWSHPKITFALTSADTSGLARDQPRVFKFSFREGGNETFHTSLQQCLQRRLWARASKAPPPPPSHFPAAGNSAYGGQSAATDEATRQSPSSTTTSATTGATPIDGLLSFTDQAGIGGLQRRQNIGSVTNDALVTNALTDVDSVLTNATSLIQEIKKIRQQLDAEGGRDDAASGTSVGLREEDFRKLLSLEDALGLNVHQYTATTRSGSSAAQQLAQEIIAWMSHPSNSVVLAARYLIPVTELYALYNSKARSRSSELMTPQMFSDALKEISKGHALTRGLPYSVRTFECGVVALICAKDFSSLIEKSLGPRPKTLADLRQSAMGKHKALRLASVDATALAQQLQVHTNVALELLEEMEAQTLLCRDERRSGASVGDDHVVCPTVCRFSWNVFMMG